MLKNLSAREQKVIIAAVIVLILLGIYLIVDSILGGYAGLDDKIALTREELKKIELLRSQHMETKQKLDVVKTYIDGIPEDFSVISFIEKLANEENIRENIGSQKPKTMLLNDEYEESSVEIEMNNITLDKLVNFIYKIENSGNLLKVKRLRMKTRYDDRNLLSVTMQVATYKKK